MSSFTSQTAYQRWELASLNDDQHRFRTMPPEIAKLAQEILASKEKAHEEGFAEGHNAGYTEGMSKGMTDGYSQALAEGQLQQQQLAQQITAVLDALTHDVQHARESIAEEILQLSFDIARAVVKTSLDQNRALILPLIETALLEIPRLELPASIHVNPDDADLLESALLPQIASEGWRLIRNHQIESGGCTISTASHLMDLQLTTRWEKLREQLELNSSAIEN